MSSSHLEDEVVELCLRLERMETELRRRPTKFTNASADDIATAEDLEGVIKRVEALTKEVRSLATIVQRLQIAVEELSLGADLEQLEALPAH